MERGLMEDGLTMRITIAGLCLVEWKQQDSFDPRECRGPAKASGARVLMVPTRAGGHHPVHRPMLTYYLEDDLALLPGPDGLINPLAAPNGRAIVNVSLQGREVDFLMPFDYAEQAACSLEWLSQGPSRERMPVGREDDRLDWLLEANEVDLLSTEIRHAASIIELPNGRWCSLGVYRNRETLDHNPVPWRIDGAKQFQAVSSGLLLELGSLRHAPRIRIREIETKEVVKDLVLQPDHERPIEIAFTNFPEVVTSDRGSHLRAFQALARSGVVKGLEREDDVATGTTPPCDTLIRIEVPNE